MYISNEHPYQLDVYFDDVSITYTPSQIVSASALLAAFSLPAPAPGEVGTPSAALNTWGSIEAGGYADGTTDQTDPKAFVNILLFDKNYKFLDVAYAQLKGTSLYYMSASYTVKEEGYAYLYVSNEQAVQTNVYFDDVKMTYTPTNIIQSNEYYPFGLQTANSWTRESNSNNFLYNEGSELNSVTGMYDLPYRNYDAALGRFFQVDPLAHRDHSISPFSYSRNNPISYNDPSGLMVPASSRIPNSPSSTYAETWMNDGGPSAGGGTISLTIGNYTYRINIGELEGAGLSLQFDNGNLTGASTISGVAELGGYVMLWGFQVYGQDDGSNAVVQGGWWDLIENYSKMSNSLAKTLQNPNVQAIHAGQEAFANNPAGGFLLAFLSAAPAMGLGNFLKGAGSLMRASAPVARTVLFGGQLTRGERAIYAGLEVINQRLSGTAWRDINVWAVASQSVLGFNSFGSVLSSSLLSYQPFTEQPTDLYGWKSSIGTSDGNWDLITSGTAGMIQDSFSKEMPFGSRILWMGLVDWIMKVEGNQLKKMN